ncbi:MAG: class C sortase [Ruminococcus sp.]|nr:class C sortase [Ruminococcus sp.]
MKKRLLIILIIVIFTAGLGILLYPLVSSIVNNINDRSEARQKQMEVEKMDSDRINDLFADAESYNSSLTDTVVLTDPFDIDSYEKIGAHYEETFDIDGNGFIGYIDIPSIDVYLPIYHGTSDEVLKKGAGHLNNTSLPIGGFGTHSVISAHSAYPSKTLFDYLLDMEEGDLFYIHVLDRVLEYRVDQIKTVLPNDVNDLYVVKGKDYVTLMTCTPYTVNTHRLLVRGERVPDDPDIVVEDDGSKSVNKTVKAVNNGRDSMYVLGYKLSYVTIIIGIGVFLLVVAAAVVLAVRRGRSRKNKGGES